ncbi:unnamed protein product [Nippostrongylus brasiliensis]|uniref:t-SNARE coiled-coil homology domain-containing protein n=1 Tax=Nippostrongylus brasiliensis TaxID=27835 RepID=A0A0N4XTK6_NIPBR|nr:unnamed protein product [Nippostrongylus brasiliensis]
MSSLWSPTPDSKNQGLPEKLPKKRSTTEQEERPKQPPKKKGRLSNTTDQSSSTASSEETPSTKCNLWKDFCERGIELFTATQKKVSDAEEKETRTTERYFREVTKRTEALEKNLAEHHSYVKSRSTTLMMDEAQMNQLVAHLTKETSALGRSLHEDIEIAKNSVLFRVGEMSTDIDRCRTEIEKTSNNALLHEIKGLMERITIFQANVEERLTAIEENQDRLLKVCAKEGMITSKEETVARVANELRRSEDILQIDEDFGEPEESVKEARKDEDRKILDELAVVNRKLDKTKHEIFVLNHRIEKERKNEDQRGRQKVEEMRKEKYELLDEEYALKKKQQQLNLALQDWLDGRKKREPPRGRDDSRMSFSRRSSSPRHGRRGV